MPKTKDADAAPFVQRRFLNESGLTDDPQLNNFAVAEKTNSDELKRALTDLSTLGTRLAVFHKRIERHWRRLERLKSRILEQFLVVDGREVDFKSRLRRVQDLQTAYDDAVCSVGDLQVQVSKLKKLTERAIDDQYRVEIGKRVAAARQACGLSQQKLADAVKVSKSFIALFELGQRELSLPALRRLIDLVVDGDANRIL